MRISDSSIKALRWCKEKPEFLGWIDRFLSPYFYAPAFSIVGQDLLMTFPDFQTLADLVLCDYVGYALASPKESNCNEVRFHQGFLRDLTRVWNPLYTLSSPD
jgi:hypothetical protein